MSHNGTLMLTGGTGMVGRNILAHPRAADWRILAPTRTELDLTDSSAVKRWISQHKPDVVLHAAGRVGGIAANIAEPVAFLTENTAMAQAVIIGAHRAGVRWLLNLASTCVYPRDAPSPLREEMILSGSLEPTNEAYALAKVFALRLCDYIRREDSGALFKTLVPCNLYGPYDHFEPQRSHLIAAILHKMDRALEDGEEEIEIWGDGSARREFLYVGDLADSALRAAAEIEAIPDTMNIGTGEDHSVLDYYRLAAEVTGWRGRFAFDRSRPVGMARKLASVDLQRAWGWAPQVTLSEGLARTWAHLREGVSN